MCVHAVLEQHHMDALQACEDCTSTTSVLKLLDSFDGVLEREGIAAFVRRQHHSLLKDFGEDLQRVCCDSRPAGARI